MQIQEMLISLFAGGGITILLRSLLFNKNGNANAYINTINMLRADNAAIKREQASLKKELDTLKLQVYDKDKALTLIEASNWDIPVPYWLKDVFGTYIYVNKAFQIMFNIDDKDVIGKTNEHIDIFKHDHPCGSDTELLHSKEEMIIYRDDSVPNCIIAKWKRYVGSVVVGISGQVVPMPKQ